IYAWAVARKRRFLAQGVLNLALQIGVCHGAYATCRILPGRSLPGAGTCRPGHASCGCRRSRLYGSSRLALGAISDVGSRSAGAHWCGWLLLRRSLRRQSGYGQNKSKAQNINWKSHLCAPNLALESRVGNTPTLPDSDARFGPSGWQRALLSALATPLKILALAC